MSGGIRKRDSKWDSKEDSRLSVEYDRKFNDKRSPRWPSEATVNNGHRLESMPVNRGGYDNGSYEATLSPGPDDLRKHHHNSPKNEWNRSRRSRSRSPVRGFRRESEVYDRSRNRLSGVPSQLCKDYAIGRCRRGNHCHFIHQENQNYEDNWDNQDRKSGSSKYSLLPDSRDYPNPSRSGRSAEFCVEFDKGNSRSREREKDIRIRDTSLERGNEHEPRRTEVLGNEREPRRTEVLGNEREPRRVEILGNEREPRRNEIPGNEREPRRTEIPCKFFAAGNCRNGKYCRFSHNENMRKSPDRRPRDDNRRMHNHNSGRENSSYDNSGRANPELHNISSYSNRGEPLVNHMDIENGDKEVLRTKMENLIDNGNHHRDNSHKWIDDVEMSPGFNFGVESSENAVKEDRGHVLIDLNSSVNALPSFEQSNHGVLNQVQNSSPDIIPSINMSQANVGTPATQNVVSSVQLTQLTNLIPQLYATLNSQNAPDMPPVEKSEVQPNKVNETQKQYDPISNSIDVKKHDISSNPKTIPPNPVGLKSIMEENSEIMPKNIPPKPPADSVVKIGGGDKESKKVEVNVLVDNLDDDSKAEEGKKSKDVKGIRLFKFSLVEFVKELLKPAWKEGQINKEDYKNIVKKAVDKVTGTIQGPSVPQTQEKIDQYLSSSKPKLTKLVQAYVEKFQKGGKEA